MPPFPPYGAESLESSLFNPKFALLLYSSAPFPYAPGFSPTTGASLPSKFLEGENAVFLIIVQIAAIPATTEAATIIAIKVGLEIPPPPDD